MKNQQRAITPKVKCLELWFLCIALLLNEIYLPMKFQVSSLNTFRVMLWTKFKNENDQRAITPKVWSLELWFLCTALLLNEIYLPMKFHVDALLGIKVMLRTKKGLTDRRTDELITTCICHPSGGIKTMSMAQNRCWVLLNFSRSVSKKINMCTAVRSIMNISWYKHSSLLRIFFITIYMSMLSNVYPGVT